MTVDTTYTPPEHVVAIVTGAGRGIGAAIAERRGADGMAVACLDIDEATARETADRLAAQGVRAAAFAADVSNEDEVERVVGEVVETLGVPTVRRSRPPSIGSPPSWARPGCWSTTPACCATTCCSR